jgi:hypothetical protein
MSTKIDVPIFLFAIMIQILFIALINIMPLSIKNNMPAFADPTAYLTIAAAPSDKFGMDSTKMGFLDYIWNLITSALNAIWFIITTIFKLLIFFTTSVIAGMYVFVGMPTFISLPLTLMLLICNLIVIIDISLVAKGLVENII